METNPTAKRTHRDLLPHDVCPRLLFKALLTDTLDNEVPDDKTFPGDGYYWCTRTCTPIGPDDGLVYPTDCRPGRSCYEGLGAAS